MPLVNADRLDTSPVPYLVGGMLPDLGIGWGYGGSYTGKSLTLGVELCMAIANGVPFYGHETIQGSAVWCIGEGLADAGIRLKARRVREQHDRTVRAQETAARDGEEAAATWLAGLPPYTDERMFVRTTPFQVPFTSGNDPTTELQQAAAELGLIDDLRFVLLDTGQNFSSLSLSNDTSANRFMLGMAWLSAQLQCTIMAVAHPVSKGGQTTGLPGNRLFNGSDFVWRFQAGQDSTADEPNAMIIAEKVKSGPLFATIAYELERISWLQPDTDPETGEELPDAPLIRVSSVTTRQRQDERVTPVSGLRLPGQPRQEQPLPQAEAVPPTRARRRTGIKPSRAFRIERTAPETAAELSTEAGTPAELAAEAAGHQALIGKIFSVPCPVLLCAAAAGKGCAHTVRGNGVIRLSEHPLSHGHIDRMDAAITAGAASLDEVLARFGEGTEPNPAAEWLTASQAASELAGARA